MASKGFRFSFRGAHGDPMGRLRLQRVQHDEQLHEHEVDLALEIVPRADLRQ